MPSGVDEHNKEKRKENYDTYYTKLFFFSFLSTSFYFINLVTVVSAVFFFFLIQLPVKLW